MINSGWTNLKNFGQIAIKFMNKAHKSEQK